MFDWPENSCLMCDMPWKNNRVRYPGGPPIPSPGGRDGSAAELCLGEMRVLAFPDGRVRLEGPEERREFATGLSIQRGTLAADVATRTLYLSAGRELLAFDLEKGKIRWRASLPEKANSPMLFELLKKDGGVLFCLGLTDISGGVFAFDREKGKPLWQTETGFATANVPAFQDGRLFLSCEGLVACLDAATGDAIWARPDQGGEEGVLTERGYERAGRRFDALDGSPLD